MAAALRHKSVRPEMSVEVRRTGDGFTMRARVHRKDSESIYLECESGARVILAATSGDSVIYYHPTGDEYKLFLVAETPQPESWFVVPTSQAAAAPNIDCGLIHHDVQPDTILLLELQGESITTTQEVYVISTVPHGLEVMHANGWHRFLVAQGPDFRTYRDPESRAGMTFRLLDAVEAVA